jgi:hypothetical protein
MLDENGNIPGSENEEGAEEQGGFVGVMKQALANFVGTVQVGGDWLFDRITTRTARVERLEVVDSKTGDVYCSWLEYGEWKKVQGECSDIDTTVDTTVAPAIPDVLIPTDSVQTAPLPALPSEPDQASLAPETSESAGGEEPIVEPEPEPVVAEQEPESPPVEQPVVQEPVAEEIPEEVVSDEQELAAGEQAEEPVAQPEPVPQEESSITLEESDVVTEEEIVEEIPVVEEPAPVSTSQPEPVVVVEEASVPAPAETPPPPSPAPATEEGGE